MPEIIDAIGAYRMALDQQAASDAARMAQVWIEATRGLEAQFTALAQDVAARQAQGLPVAMWHVARLNRYQALMGQIDTQLRAFPATATADISAAQRTHAQLAVDHSSRLLDMQTNAIVSQFDRINVNAVANMVGNVGDGTPLGRLLREAVGEASGRVGQQLAMGVARGWHPEKIARAMRQGLNLGLERSILISRTEVMRVYRETSRKNYIESGLVEGYRRIAAKSVRTCIACLMADGRYYPLDVPFEEHPAGRCTMVPVRDKKKAISWETGETWFRRQDAQTQRTILGPGRYDAWQRGQFDLDAVVTRIDDPVWGASLHPTPLRELLAE